MSTAFQINPNTSIAILKARQTAKIKEIRAELCAAGYIYLDEQALALDLGRSTAWTVLAAKHKSSGLSAAIVLRMLRSPFLPTDVRQVILEYVREKGTGRYGGTPEQVRRFETRILTGLVCEFRPSERTSESQPKSRRLLARRHTPAWNDVAS